MRLHLLPRVDWYVTRSVLGLMAMFAISVCFLVAVVDAFQRVDEFVEFSRETGYGTLATSALVVEYYLCLAPQYFLQYMVPFVSMLSGVSVVAMMAGHREFTALRASGVPLQRVLLPALVSVLVVGAVFYAARDAVLPALARRAYRNGALLEGRAGEAVTRVLRVDDAVYTYAMGRFDPTERTATDFRMDLRSWTDIQAGRTSVYEYYTAPQATLADGHWVLGSGAQHFLQSRFRQETRPVPGERLATRVTPAMLEEEMLGAVVLTSSDLIRLSENRSRRVELARRRATALTGLVVLLVGISILLKREQENPGSRVGRVKSIIYAILICAGYYLVMGLCLSLAEDGMLHPTVGAWIPNLAFGGWGAFRYWKVNL
jgi:lipopolysaccharide export system permease protein